MEDDAAKSRSSDPLQKLLSMPLADRIASVSGDVRTRTDEFCSVHPHRLAEALGVPTTKRPNRSDWAFTDYAQKQSLEEYADQYGRLSDCVSVIEGKVPAQLFESLVQKSSALDELQLDILTDEERREFEEALAFEDLRSNMDNGICCVAHYSVQGHGGDLWFEATIEDDGACIDLKTPYDQRDGKFLNLNDCVTDSQLLDRDFGEGDAIDT